MKNIRILEDGNRLIVVLEGYEKSAVNALMEMLGTTAAPLSHINPHTGEANFQLKGTEKEILLPKKDTKAGDEPEIPIKPPVFIEQMRQKEASAAAARKEGEPVDAGKPARKASAGKTSAPKKDEPSIPPEIPDIFMPLPEATAQGLAGTEESAKTPEPAKTAGTVKLSEETEAVSGKNADTGTKKPTKPVEFMNSFELRAYIQQADKEKVSALLRRKGRFPNVMHLLNSDDRTVREYVRELLLSA